MTYLEECEMFYASLDSTYNKLHSSYLEEDKKYVDLKKAVDTGKMVLKPLKQMVEEVPSHQYSDLYKRHYEESVAINATLEKEMLDALKKRDEFYRRKFDLEYGSKNLLRDKIVLMKKVGIVSDIVSIYYFFHVDDRNNELRSLVIDGKTARFSSNRYASISNFSAGDLGVELQVSFLKHQIAEGATRKASKVFSLGFKDLSLYLIVLSLDDKLKTTYILGDGGEFATVETHKYDPKIKSYYLRKELSDKIPKSELVKTFFNHLDSK